MYGKIHFETWHTVGNLTSVINQDPHNIQDSIGGLNKITTSSAHPIFASEGSTALKVKFPTESQKKQCMMGTGIYTPVKCQVFSKKSSNVSFIASEVSTPSLGNRNRQSPNNTYI